MLFRSFIDQETGEYGERRLSHPEEAEQFYRSLAGRNEAAAAGLIGSAYRIAFPTRRACGHFN